MKPKKKEKLPLIITLCSALLLLGVATVFRACAPMEDGGWMHCHTAQTTLMILSSVMLIASLFDYLSGSKVVGIISEAIVLVLAAVSFFVPGKLVSMCMMNTMRCHAVMKPFALVMTILIAVLCLGRLIGLLRKKA